MRQSVELYQAAAMTLLRLDRSEYDQETDDPMALHFEVQGMLNRAQALSRKWSEMDPGRDLQSQLKFMFYKILIQQIAMILGVYFLAAPYIFLPTKGRSEAASDLVVSLKVELVSRFAVLREAPALIRVDKQDRVGAVADDLLKGFNEAMNRIVFPAKEVVETWEVQSRAGDWDRANFEHYQRLQAEVGTHVTIETGFVGPTTRGTLQVSFVAVAGERLVWAAMSEPQTIRRMDLRAVVKVEEDSEGRFRLTTDDRAGESQVVEVAASEGEPGRLASSLVESLKRVAPFYEPSRAAALRLASLQRVPVNTWEACPGCGGLLAEHNDHAVRCVECPRYYSDPGFAPVVSKDSKSFGRLDGYETWMPISENDFRYRDCTQVWIQFPIDFLTGPILIPDHELLDSSLDISEG